MRLFKHGGESGARHATRTRLSLWGYFRIEPNCTSFFNVQVEVLIFVTRNLRHRLSVQIFLPLMQAFIFISSGVSWSHFATYEHEDHPHVYGRAMPLSELTLTSLGSFARSNLFTAKKAVLITA